MAVRKKKDQRKNGDAARDQLRQAIVRAQRIAEIGAQPKGSWLEAVTGKTDAWWIARFQSLVTKHSKSTDNPDHGTTDTLSLMHV